MESQQQRSLSRLGRYRAGSVTVCARDSRRFHERFQTVPRAIPHVTSNRGSISVQLDWAPSPPYVKGNVQRGAIDVERRT